MEFIPYKAHECFEYLYYQIPMELFFNKKYKDKHFGYNFWKWATNRFKCQKDIFTEEERKQIGELLKKEWSLK